MLRRVEALQRMNLFDEQLAALEAVSAAQGTLKAAERALQAALHRLAAIDAKIEKLHPNVLEAARILGATIA
jgi:hypothetical protein